MSKKVDKFERDEVFERMKSRSWKLENEPTHYRNDKEIVLEAVKKFRGLGETNFEYASEELRNDKDIALAAVKQNGATLRFCSEELRNDKDVVLEAVSNNGSSVQFSSERLRNDKDVGLTAMKNDGYALVSLSENLRNDFDVVKTAVVEFLEKDELNEFTTKNNLIGGVVERSPLLQLLKSMKGDIESCVDEYERLKKTNDDLPEEDLLWEELFIEKMKTKPTKKNDFSDLKFKKDLVTRRFYEEDHIKELQHSLSVMHFKDLKIIRSLGKGAYGSAYLCCIDYFGLFVVKIYNDTSMGVEKKKELIDRDSLYIDHHPNVASILYHSEKTIVDFRTLPDYDDFWEDIVGGKKKRKKVGMILMKYHRITLTDYFNPLFNVKESKGEEEEADDWSLFSSSKEFEMSRILKIIKGIVFGVCHLHENMIVHRDLHPGNIFVDPELGRIWIGDFGCALDLRKNPTKFKVHKDHKMMFSLGTFPSDGNRFKKGGAMSYIAPEIREFEKSQKEYLEYEKCDLFSIGVMMDILVNTILKRTTGLTDIDQFDGTVRMVRSYYFEEIELSLRNLVKKLLVRDPIDRISFKEAKDEIMEINKQYEDGCLRYELTPITTPNEPPKENLEKKNPDDEEIFRISFSKEEVCLENEKDAFDSFIFLDQKWNVSVLPVRSIVVDDSNNSNKFSFSLSTECYVCEVQINVFIKELEEESIFPMSKFRKTWKWSFSDESNFENGLNLEIKMKKNKMNDMFPRVTAYDDLKQCIEISKKSIRNEMNVVEFEFEDSSFFSVPFTCCGIPFRCRLFDHDDFFEIRLEPLIIGFENLADFKIISKNNNNVVELKSHRGLSPIFKFFKKKEENKDEKLKFFLEMTLKYLGDDVEKDVLKEYDGVHQPQNRLPSEEPEYGSVESGIWMDEGGYSSDDMENFFF